MSRRIRSIKPEWLDDERMGAASDEARLLSIALILMADDYGRGRGALATIAAGAWQYHLERDDGAHAPETLAKVSRALRELLALGFVHLYTVDNQRYFAIRSWAKHQRVDHPGKPQVPAPPAPEPLDNPAIPETLAKSSRDSRETLATDQDQEGTRKGPGGGAGERGRKRPRKPPPPAPESLPTPDTAPTVADSRPEEAPPGPAAVGVGSVQAQAPATALPAPPTGAGTEAFLRSLSPTPERDRAALDVLSRARQAAGGAPLVPSSHADRDAIARLGEWSAAMPAGSLERAAAAFWAAKGAGAPLRWLADDDPGKWLATKPAAAARTNRDAFRACPPPDAFTDRTKDFLSLVGGES